MGISWRDHSPPHGYLYLSGYAAAPVNRFLAFFLAALMLLQTLGREVLVVDYQLNKARITALYCVNKARPTLHCNGKCHLAKQLRKTEGDPKAPAGAVAKVKFEVLPTTGPELPRPHWRPAVPVRYPALAAARWAPVPATGVFRPPHLG